MPRTGDRLEELVVDAIQRALDHQHVAVIVPNAYTTDCRELIRATACLMSTRILTIDMDDSYRLIYCPVLDPADPSSYFRAVEPSGSIRVLGRGSAKQLLRGSRLHWIAVDGGGKEDITGWTMVGLNEVAPLVERY